MKKFSKLLVTMLVVVMTFASAKVVYGRTLCDKTMRVDGKNWWGGASVSRDINYSRVYMKLLAVYPVDGRNDNYERAKFRMTSTYGGTELSDVYVVREGSEALLQIKEGYLSISNVTYQVKGNKESLEAYVHFQYDTFLSK